MNLATSVPGAILLFLSFLILVPIGTLFAECIAALFASTSSSAGATSPRPRLAILVPAHNEATGIATTLENLLTQLSDSDTLLVVADNCTDTTATIARELGATVIERNDIEHQGKGYALDFGLQFLTTNPPEVVVIVDADCTVTPGGIEELTHQALIELRPVQAAYLLTQPATPTPKDAVSVLAFTVKNLVRPLGLRQLGLPCLLTGTGMAFPWTVIQSISLASGNLVEDMQLSLDLAIAGYPTGFCAAARATGALPGQSQAAKSQRTRWEHGHLKTLITQVPRLVKAGLQQKRLDLLAIALDLSIPPLSLLVMLWLSTLGLSVLVVLVGGASISMLILAIEGMLLLIAILAVWIRFIKSDLPIGTLLSVPLYILWKIPLYLTFLINPQTKWVRTERDRIDPSNH